MSNQEQRLELPQAGNAKEKVDKITTTPEGDSDRHEQDMHAFWHSSSHVLAHAVKRLWPVT